MTTVRTITVLQDGDRLHLPGPTGTLCGLDALEMKLEHRPSHWAGIWCADCLQGDRMDEDNSQHSVHVDRLQETLTRVRSDFDLTLTVRGVKEEHASYVARQLFILQRIFKLDGTDVETTLSATQGMRSDVERIYELIPSEEA